MMKEFILGFIFISILITPFIALGWLIEGIECNAKAKALGYKGNYGIIQGCIVEKNGKKALLKQLRSFE